ncbi:unnamed protein product [Clonostachys solani]|uniref:Uncharacterized protein n=1 Tax=Clonostachys solani TaxID=160281 RepID=A0A9P0EKM4_9HYPO|nr:unnamed protein product [Clonostachys solani]
MEKAEGPVAASPKPVASDIPPLRNMSNMGGGGGKYPYPAEAESQRQIHKSTTTESSPSSSEHPSTSAASGSTLSQQSNDTNDTKSTSIISSSLASVSCKPKKKRYATQHETRWLEEGQPSDPFLKQSSGLTDQPLPTLPKSQQIEPVAQPQSLTPPSVVSTVSPALSILGSSKYARMSPGQDAPAIQPGAPSAYLAAVQPLNHGSLRSQNIQSETTNGDALSAIDEERTIRGRSVSPSPSAPQPEPSKLRRGLSKLLRRNH